LSSKHDQVDQGQPMNKGHIVLVACCVIVLLGVFICALMFNLYAAG
jgi:hypothetical protein